jgi:hypothetical protein
MPFVALCGLKIILVLAEAISGESQLFCVKDSIFPIQLQEIWCMMRKQSNPNCELCCSSIGYDRSENGLFLYEHYLLGKRYP